MSDLRCAGELGSDDLGKTVRVDGTEGAMKRVLHTVHENQRLTSVLFYRGTAVTVADTELVEVLP